MLTITFNDNDIDKKNLQVAKMLLRAAGIKFNIEKVSTRGKYYDVLYDEAECRVDELYEDLYYDMELDDITEEQLEEITNIIANRYWNSEVFDYDYMRTIARKEMLKFIDEN